MQKFFRIEQPQDVQISNILNNPSFVSSNQIISRPKTSQPTRERSSESRADEGLKIFRVRPKLISKEAFKNNIKPEAYDLKLQTQPQSQNLFQQNQHLWDQLEQADKGPRLDERGQILKYSLVGSAQAFAKEQQHQNQTTKNNRISIKINHDMQPHEALHDSHNETTMNKVNFHSQALKQKKHQNKKYKEVILSREELDEKISLCKQNIKDANQNVLRFKYFGQAKILKRNAYSHLEKGDQLFLSQFERTTEKYGQAVEDWQTLEQKFALRIGRKPENSIYRKSEQFRTTKEAKEVLEAITSDQEKFGDKAWQFGLRQAKSSMNLSNPYKFADPIEGGQYGDQKCPIIEIIRKPLSSKLRSKFEGKSPYSSFTSGIHHEAKLQLHNQEINKLLLCNQKDVVELEIQGHNVLNSEIKSLTRQLNITEKFVSKILKEEDDDHIHNHPPEILEVQWDRKKLLQSGKFAIAKTSFFIKD